MKLLIVNADDFGLSPGVNAAVIRAHSEGILTSASLMTGEPGWEDAVALARSHPALGVGLHVTVSYDHSVLPPAEIPLLVDSNGRFGTDPLRVGIKYALSAAARKQLRREMEAQFARFAATGLPWSHADGHQHLHLHPAVWPIFRDLCQTYGVTRIRLPREELRAHFRSGGAGPDLNTAAAIFMKALRRRALRHLQRLALNARPTFSPERVYGLLQSGNMHAGYVRSLVGRLRGDTNEIYFHPGSAYTRSLPPDRRWNGITDVELDALVSPDIRRAVEAAGVCLCSYAEAEERASGRTGEQANRRTGEQATPRSH